LKAKRPGSSYKVLKNLGLAFVLETLTLTNPHGLKVITKLTASGEKSHYYNYPTPCTALLGGAGEGGAFSVTLKVCVIKT
jgi:hypothetical protein